MSVAVTAASCPRRAVQDVAVVALPHLTQSGRLGDSHLFWTDVNADRVVSIGDEQPHQGTLPTPDVNNRTRLGVWEQGTDVTVIGQGGENAATVASML